VLFSDQGSSLALLAAQNDQAEFSFLPLGDDAQLRSTLPVTAFAFPSGRSLAHSPDITVAVGGISNLLRREGKLDRIEVYATLDPNSRGAPICNDRGEVIAVSTGAFGQDVLRGIPIGQLRALLSKPRLSFQPTHIAASRKHDAIEMPIYLETFDRQPLRGVVVDLQLTSEGQPVRTIAAKAINHREYRVTLVPIPAAAPGDWLRMKGTIHYPFGLIQGSIANRQITIGDKSLALTEVRTIVWGSESEVIRHDGQRFVGALTGLDQLTIGVDGAPLTLDVTRAKRLDLQPATNLVPVVHYLLRARRGTDELARQSGVLSVEDSGVVASAPPPEPPQPIEVQAVVIDKLREITLPPSMVVNESIAYPPSDVNGCKFTQLGISAADLVGDLCWSPSGDAFYTLSAKGELRRVRMEEGQFVEERRLEMQRRASWLTLSAVGLVAAMSDLQEAWLIDPCSLEVKSRIASPAIDRVLSGPDLRFALGVTQEIATLRSGYVAYLDLEAGLPLHRQVLPVRHARLTPDGKRYFIESGSKLVGYRIQDQKLVLDQESEPKSDTWNIYISPDSRYVCLASRGFATDIFPVGDLRRPDFKLPHMQLGCAGFDPAGKLVFAQHRDLPLLVLNEHGIQLAEYALPLSRNSGAFEARQIVAHPAGKKLLILGNNALFFVELALSASP
jgi:hypothetical protein